MGYPEAVETLEVRPTSPKKVGLTPQRYGIRDISERKSENAFTLRQTQTDIQQMILSQIEQSMKLELEEKRIDQAMLQTEAEITRMKHKEVMAQKEVEKIKLEKETLDLELKKIQMENERLRELSQQSSCVCTIM